MTPLEAIKTGQKPLLNCAKTQNQWDLPLL